MSVSEAEALGRPHSDTDPVGRNSTGGTRGDGIAGARFDRADAARRRDAISQRVRADGNQTATRHSSVRDLHRTASIGQGPGTWRHTRSRSAQSHSRSVLRVDIDAVFAARLAAVEAARQAAREVTELRSWEGRAAELRRTAALAGRSTKGGHVALNRFKARVRHFFNWAIAQGYRDDTPFKRHGVNVVRLNGAAETVRARRLQPGEEERLIAAATPHLRALIVGALSTGCRVGELLTLQWQDVQSRRQRPVPRADSARWQDQDRHDACRARGPTTGGRPGDAADRSRKVKTFRRRRSCSATKSVRASRP